MITPNVEGFSVVLPSIRRHTKVFFTPFLETMGLLEKKLNLFLPCAMSIIFNKTFQMRGKFEKWALFYNFGQKRVFAVNVPVLYLSSIFLQYFAIKAEN